LDVEEKKKPSFYKVNSVEDLPKLIEQGTYTPSLGMQLIKKFLTDDDDSLKEVGAVYDQTGFDAIDPSEEIYPKDTQQRIEQRAKSAALMWVKTNEPNSDFDVYGVQKGGEVLKDWLTFDILMMNSNGKHRMVKVCILEKETDGYLNYGMDVHENCRNKTDTMKDLEIRAKKYFKDSGFDKFTARETDKPKNLKKNKKNEDVKKTSASNSKDDEKKTEKDN